MSRHVTYRGVSIDMDSFSREHEKVPAIGNMKVNARGDQISGGKITKTADQIARENHRVQQAVINTGLKGKQPTAPADLFQSKKVTPTTTVSSPSPVMVEKELPSGDIVMVEKEGE